jgi:enoyl-CoA hydratase/carnithine racemase
MTNHILSIRHGAVLEARLNRPEKKNALTGAMYDGIAEILEQASASNSIRAVLLTAEGSTFTAGNDLAEFMSVASDSAVSPQSRFIRAIKAPEALAAARRLMRGNKTQLDAHIAMENEAFRRAVRGPEAREAFAAFFEKRKPVLVDR